MFHYVTGIPFHSDLHGGVYDNLTMWEQIDEGAQYTPTKKWLLIVPITLSVLPSSISSVPLAHVLLLRFLASTHYTHYDPWLFAINLSALVFVLIPKLPQVRTSRTSSVLIRCNRLTHIASSTDIACASWCQRTLPASARPLRLPSPPPASRPRHESPSHQSTSAKWTQGYDHHDMTPIISIFWTGRHR